MTNSHFIAQINAVERAKCMLYAHYKICLMIWKGKKNIENVRKINLVGILLHRGLSNLRPLKTKWKKKRKRNQCRLPIHLLSMTRNRNAVATNSTSIEKINSTNIITLLYINTNKLGHLQAHHQYTICSNYKWSFYFEWISGTKSFDATINSKQHANRHSTNSNKQLIVCA